MDKLDMESKNIVSSNIEKIKELFPNVVTEDGKKEVINFDALKQELSEVIIEEKKEKYQLTWPGKKQAIVNANVPINKTLRPIKEKSVNFDTTKNIYIEGDNLDALKILQESYLNKIKCIYIDPPYNTGNDFIYNDKFDKLIEEELIDSGQVDEAGNRLIANTESNGRFHSDWLTMIYPRIKLARNLLSDDGAIFISIDDAEQSSLKVICDEIFGERNFISTFIWQRAYAPVNLNKYSSQNHDYILAYAKNVDKLRWYYLDRTEDANQRYINPDNDCRGVWQSDNFSVGPRVESKVYPIVNPAGREILPPSGRCWRVTKEKYEEMLKDNRVWFGSDGNGVPRVKRFLSEVRQGMTPMTIWTYDEVGHSQDAKKELINLFDGKSYFDYPKSVRLLERILKLSTLEDDIILDFFSGSATTAQANFLINSKEQGKRRFIMVQLPEKCNEKSEAFKDGYKTICDIGQERIRRAAKKIKEEANANIDYGFRVYKVDDSNMKDVFYKPNEVQQANLFDYMSNVKEDRTPEDLLTQVILDLGLTLDLPIEEKTIGNNKIYYVAGNSLVACFDDVVDINIIDTICECQPLKVVFKDSSFRTDKDKINLEERVKKASTETKISIL